MHFYETRKGEIMTFELTNVWMRRATCVAVLAAAIALAFALMAPDAIAVSKWLALPGFTMPCWLPLATALVAALFVRGTSRNAAFALLVVSLALSFAMVATCTIALV